MCKKLYMTKLDFDVIITGAGPSGCATAIMLADSGLKVALIDKAVFPRDKICGDGLTIDVLNQLKLISPTLSRNIENFKEKTEAEGCYVTSTKGHSSFFKITNPNKLYVIERALFDNELLKECKRYNNIHVFENTRVNKCTVSNHQVSVESSAGLFSGKIVVGADGVNSKIAKTVNPNRGKESLYGVSVRAYFSNVTDSENTNVIEIHYLKELVPGYLWIFHMPNNKRNVGIGIDEKTVKKNGIKLGEVFHQIIKNNPKFKDRFANAKMEGDLKAYRLPVFNNYKKIYSDRVLLVGDAANVVNPLSGEGVGNALRTGRFAAEHIQKCFTANDFSKKFNKAYYKKVKKKMFPELYRHTAIAILSKSELLSNYALKDNSLLNKLIRKFFT